MPIVTLTTDFGTGDGYVGAMKGVILRLAPHVTLVDISHDVPRQDVRHCARVLATATPYFPSETIHVAVVDPGVGTSRRGIALRAPCGTFVGPDNGVFTPFLRERIACVALTNPATQLHPVSATFHGRDIFAPVAAHLANGFALRDLGPTVEDPVSNPEPQPERLAIGRLRAEVVHVDRFGNLVTNLQPSKWEAADLRNIRIVVKGLTLPVRYTYAEVEPDALLALVGSDGFLEIAVREGSAAKRLGLGVGAIVEVQGL